jgi:hypothetical protein
MPNLSHERVHALFVMLVTATLAIAVLAPPAPASARVSEEYTYTFDQMWRASVRMVAVDFRFPVTDRDEEIGYLLFEYRDQGRSYSGSIEMVRTEGTAGTPQVRVVIQVGALPSYVERMMLDRLTRKLMDEYGAPPSVHRAPPRAPVRSGDDDEPPSDAPDDGTDAPTEDGPTPPPRS